MRCSLALFATAAPLCMWRQRSGRVLAVVGLMGGFCAGACLCLVRRMLSLTALLPLTSRGCSSLDGCRAGLRRLSRSLFCSQTGEQLLLGRLQAFGSKAWACMGAEALRARATAGNPLASLPRIQRPPPSLPSPCASCAPLHPPFAVMAGGVGRATEELQLSVCIGVDEDDALAADEAALRNCFPQLPVSAGMRRPEEQHHQLPSSACCMLAASNHKAACLARPHPGARGGLPAR